MTDRTQFEAMLEALINEDQETAKEIFHNIVVAKSREIYESLLDENDTEEKKKYDDDQGQNLEEVEDDEEDDTGTDDAADDSEDGEDDVGGDATDDMIGDLSDEEDGEESEEGGDMEDRVMDLEDALDELKAEFEQLMAGEEGEEHDMGGDEFGAEPEMGGDEFGSADELDNMMEYVNKISPPKHGDNGVNTRSAVAGKNDMGGTTANIAKSFSTEKGGTQGGLLKPTTSIQDGGNINKPGANAGKTAFKKKEPGHGAEKKGSGDTAPDRKSLIGSRK
jgi:hypothetical protein